MSDMSQLARAIDEGDREKAVALAKEALNNGIDASEIISRGLQAGMSVVGDKYSSGEYFLPDMLMAARAMKTALEEIKPALGKTGIPTIGRVVIGTVAGDMHDVGKNVVATFLGGSGFEVHDLGLNVADQTFVDEVRARQADILGLSALLTTTMPLMGRIIQLLDEAGLRSSVKVIVGGAPVTQDYADYIGADAYAHDGGKAIRVCRQLMEK
ncbi:MAG: corrinoid protein [Chloroflexi bacterium]|nr:corrinoid protein [Chloroflexota bacterium]